MKRWSSLTLAIVAASLTACSGHVNAIPAAPNGLKQSQSAAVTVRLKVPSKSSASGSRSPKYVSPSTQSVKLTAGTASVAFNLSNSTYCAAGVCTVSIAAPIGQDTFSLSTYDGVLDATGVPQGNLLSTASVAATVIAGTANTVNLTMNPVVASVALTTSVPWNNSTRSNFIAGTPATMSVTVNALDADNNVIVGPGSFVDRNGNPITLSIADSDTSGNTALNTTSLSAPSSAPISISYNGKTFNGVYPSLSVSASGVTTVSQSLAVAGLYRATIPGDAFIGADGNLWGLSGGLAQLNVTTGNLTSWYFGNWTNVGEITQGSDGNFYAQEISATALDRITPTGTVTQITSVVDASDSLGYYPMASGKDGNLWMVGPDDPCSSKGSASCFGYYVMVVSPGATSGTSATYAVPAITANGQTNQPHGFDLSAVEGTDGNFWFTQLYNGAIGAVDSITTSGALAAHVLPGQSSTVTKKAHIIVNGSDGNVWFAASVWSNGHLTGQEVGKIDSAGAIAEYALPAGYTLLEQLTAGTDGNIWFVTQDPSGTFYAGEVNVTTGALNVTPAVANTSPYTGPGFLRGYEINGKFYFADMGVSMIN